MSSPPIAVKPDISCREANDQLTQYNINALLIMESDDHGDRLLGYITRQVIEKALYHRLEDVAVREYMSSELVVAEPEADLVEIQHKIIEYKQRILPVVDRQRVAGVITRTDLLNTLVSQSRSNRENPPEPFTGASQARTRSVVRFMKERLSKRLIDMLKDIGRVAEELGYGAYVVGGFVRDLFLYRADADLDVVIEGDGINFARQYAKIAGARVNTHAKFGTAVIIFPDGFKIDVATARLEYYKFPAALPVVEMSSIKLDLYRRDFTINTLAIQLNPERFGVLIDFFAAQRDIKEKVVRVLHNLSFVEDPTRVFRAIRFEQRFNFTIGKLTAGLIQNAVNMHFFKRLSGKRVFGELRQILEEENPVAAIIRLNDFKLLDVIHASIRFDNQLVSRLNTTKQVLTWFDLLFLDESYMKWAVYFMVLIQNCNQAATEQICRRFELIPRFRRVVVDERMAAQKCLKRLQRYLPSSNSTLYDALAGFRLELCLYMMSVTPKQKVKKAISHYITQLRGVTISLTGKDLKKMGLQPGPAYRKTLQACLHAKLNGKLKTRNDEIRFAQRFIQDI
jgi:tRNA nucleotidyltransferase (CCA-adding enzyme)